MAWPAASCQLSGSSQDIELLLSLWSSSCSDLPYRSLAALDWLETVFSVHCQRHDVDLSWHQECATVCIKLQVLFVFQWLQPKRQFGDVSWRVQCSGMKPIYTWVVFMCDCVSLFMQIKSTNQLQLLFLAPATKIMWCLSTDLFTLSKVFFFVFFKW